MKRSSKTQNIAEELKNRVWRSVRKALRAVGHPPKAVEIFFVGEEEMRALKSATTGMRARHAYRQAGTVDVLAFEEPKGFPHPDRKVFLGEVYVNFERYGTDPDRLLSLVVHGVAHLLGFRHDGRRDTIEMQRVEKELLAYAGGAR